MKTDPQATPRLMRILIGLGLMLAVADVSAQMSSEAVAAKQALERGDYALCPDLYRRTVAAQPFPTSAILLQAARCMALAGQREQALSLVREAIDHPVFREHDELSAGEDFASLHTAPEWPQLMQLALRKSALPPAMGSGVDVRDMHRHLPAVPRELLRATGARALTLIVWVAPDASPSRVDVEVSSGSPRVDAIAVDAAKSWKYTAATSSGETFGYPTRIPLTFPP
jgi:TonB family protein